MDRAESFRVPDNRREQRKRNPEPATATSNNNTASGGTAGATVRAEKAEEALRVLRAKVVEIVAEIREERRHNGGLVTDLRGRLERSETKCAKLSDVVRTLHAQLTHQAQLMVPAEKVAKVVEACKLIRDERDSLSARLLDAEARAARMDAEVARLNHVHSQEQQVSMVKEKESRRATEDHVVELEETIRRLRAECDQKDGQRKKLQEELSGAASCVAQLERALEDSRKNHRSVSPPKSPTLLPGACPSEVTTQQGDRSTSSSPPPAGQTGVTWERSRTPTQRRSTELPTLVVSTCSGGAAVPSSSAGSICSVTSAANSNSSPSPNNSVVVLQSFHPPSPPPSQASGVSSSAAGKSSAWKPVTVTRPNKGEGVLLKSEARSPAMQPSSASSSFTPSKKSPSQPSPAADPEVHEELLSVIKNGMPLRKTPGTAAQQSPVQPPTASERPAPRTADDLLFEDDDEFDDDFPLGKGGPGDEVRQSARLDDLIKEINSL